MQQTPHAVITGAADGIGKALAQCCAATGYRVVGIDRDAAQAARTQTELAQAGADIEFIQADLASEAAIEHVLHSLGAGPPIDLFVHNAGINAVGHFGHLDPEQQQAVLDVNLLAPLLLTAGLLRHEMLASGATLVFMASLSCFVGYPGAAVYAASKDGLAAYARSLRIALAGQNIHVLTVYPGPTRTAHARRYSPDNRREARRMPPEHLAAQILVAVQQRQHVLIPDAAGRLFALLGRYAPGLAERVMKQTILNRLPKQTDIERAYVNTTQRGGTQ
jgi:short-subunit dehydrogenase